MAGDDRTTREARTAGPRLLVPETVQTSGMDCGPAALRSLLAGFGLEVSYGRLREACQTDVDGTSINALEATARALGMDVAQLMLPADHVAIPCATALPAIAVSRLPSGMPHFVVAWRRHGRWVQLMDPATGRRLVGARGVPGLPLHPRAAGADGRVGGLRGRTDVSGRAARAVAGARRCASATPAR